MPSQTFINLKTVKKEKIIEAISNELSRVDYDHINIQNIIKEANIARGSFYQYFNDKDDMYQFFLSYVSQIKAVYYKDILNNDERPFIERIDALYFAGLNFKKEHPKIFKAGEFIMQSPLFMNSKMVIEGYENVLSMYENWIKIDQDKGLIRTDIHASVLAKIILDFLNKVTIDSFIYQKLDEKAWYINIKSILDIFKKGISNHV